MPVCILFVNTFKIQTYTNTKTPKYRLLVSEYILYYTA